MVNINHLGISSGTYCGQLPTTSGVTPLVLSLLFLLSFETGSLTRVCTQDLVLTRHTLYQLSYLPRYIDIDVCVYIYTYMYIY